MEEEYKRLLEEIRDVYFVVQDEKLVLVSSRLTEKFGYSSDEIIGMPFMELIAPEVCGRVQGFYHKRLAGQEVPGQYETIMITKSGNRVPVEASVWRTEYRGRPAIAGIAQDITERERRQSEKVKAQEDERRRLARALHDETVQELLLVCHRLQDLAAGTYGELPKRALDNLGKLQQLVQRTIAELRNLAYALRPSILDDMGLVSALRWLTNRFTEEDGVRAKASISGEERRLSTEVELTLFRIAQESLSNVRKHAGASTASVVLEFRTQTVQMSVEDNGRGFELPVPTNNVAIKSNMGLANMCERAQLFGGQCTVESVPGKGTVVRVEMPA